MLLPTIAKHLLLATEKNQEKRITAPRGNLELLAFGWQEGGRRNDSNGRLKTVASVELEPLF